MQTPDELPPGLISLASELVARGFDAVSDEGSGELFREVILSDGDRKVVLTKDRGLWGVELELAGRVCGVYALLQTMNGEIWKSRALSHEERRAMTLEVLDRLPSAGSDRDELLARFDQLRREENAEYNRRMSGADE